MWTNPLPDTSIPLLKYALNSSDAEHSSYFISESSNDVNFGLLDDRKCLIKRADGKWVCFYQERGKKKYVAEFDNSRQAAMYFFVWIVGGPTPWDFREQWEAEGRPT